MNTDAIFITLWIVAIVAVPLLGLAIAHQDPRRP